MMTGQIPVEWQTVKKTSINKLFLSVHNDDECLYGAYTIMQEKPLVCVVTDSYRQFERGDGITKEQRISETEMAMDILDAEVMFLHVPDNSIPDDCLDELDADLVYAPYPEEGGNPDHNKIGELAKKRWGNRVIFYSTYTKGRPYPQGDPVKFSEDEYKHKIMALDCYQSQLGMTNKYYFDQMRRRPECLVVK